MNQTYHRHRSSASPAFAICFAVALLLPAGSAVGETTVSVLVNRTDGEVQFTVTRDGVLPQEYTLKAGERRQLSPERNAKVMIGSGTEAQSVALVAGTVFAFEKNAKGAVELRAVGQHQPKRGAGAAKSPPRGPALPAIGSALDGKPAADEKRDVLRIPVKILVDEEEMAKTEVWQKRLKDRVESASDILERQANIRFHVVEFATWRSNNRTTDFVESLTEFEHLVEPGPARVAIGFTSQYQLVLGRTHLGGTRGPFARHVLVREWSRQISEPERLEVLLHELGHHLGATHSAAADSVMRPVLGDRKSRLVKFEIRFDDVNARIIKVVGDELREKRIRRLADVSPMAKQQLRAAYDELGKGLPQDPATKRMVQLLESSPTRRTTSGSSP
jgi:predicted Zn-dependent protease